MNEKKGKAEKTANPAGEAAVRALEAEVERLSRECEEKGRERAELRVRKTAGIEG